MPTLLPTGAFDTWAITDFRNSITDRLISDTRGDDLQLFFYAVTRAGWYEIRSAVKKWMQRRRNRTVTIYLGTDHALTDPAAMEQMQRDGLVVRLMSVYRGVFHPKVVWLSGSTSSVVWVGSNNLTKDGLCNNIEFAVVVEAEGPAPGLPEWATAVADGSSLLTPELLESYRKERESFEHKRAAAKDVTFTWSRKQEPNMGGINKSMPRRGDLVLEIMPEETRGGTQVQFPKAAAQAFFGLKRVRQQKTIQLQREGTREVRELVVTVFSNSTVRVSINDLEYRDRPCVIIFRKGKNDRVTFEIVPQSIFPSRYKNLIDMCVKQTRAGSRRWTIL